MNFFNDSLQRILTNRSGKAAIPIIHTFANPISPVSTFHTEIIKYALLVKTIQATHCQHHEKSNRWTKSIFTNNTNLPSLFSISPALQLEKEVYIGIGPVLTALENIYPAPTLYPSPTYGVSNYHKKLARSLQNRLDRLILTFQIQKKLVVFPRRLISIFNEKSLMTQIDPTNPDAISHGNVFKTPYPHLIDLQLAAFHKIIEDSNYRLLDKGVPKSLNFEDKLVALGDYFGFQDEFGGMIRGSSKEIRSPYLEDISLESAIDDFKRWQLEAVDDKSNQNVENSNVTSQTSKKKEIELVFGRGGLCGSLYSLNGYEKGLCEDLEADDEKFIVKGAAKRRKDGFLSIDLDVEEFGGVVTVIMSSNGVRINKN